MPKRAIIIGAGPAGLTAAYELLTRTDIIPIVLEKSGDIGGISKTVQYKGNRIDIGGHRFFSKSDRVMEWWLNIFPVQPLAEDQFTITYRRQSRVIRKEKPVTEIPHLQGEDKVMLVRKRLSRIYFIRKFFTYPIQLSIDTLRKLGLFRTAQILFSYLHAKLMPRKPEKNLEDFFINRFGRKLYTLFFRDYTEKVWGLPCSQISAEWGAQRVKGISIAKALQHAIKSLKPKKTSDSGDIGQKGTETSLIEKFLYPKLGPGQLWEEVARQIEVMGGTVLKHQDVTAIIPDTEQKNVVAIETVNSLSGEKSVFEGDYFFSTMPVKELIAKMQGTIPGRIREIADGLQYRDFITVGVLLKKLIAPAGEMSAGRNGLLPDTWIYVQERDVKVGRLQFFNNWSPHLVRDPDNIWIGMEYFCNTTDEFWQLSDREIAELAIGELGKMGLADSMDVLDSTVLRVEKTYPAYFGTYEQFGEVRDFTDGIGNLFLVGRNGMHKYNNSDHSMLTAMVAVDNIIRGVTEKSNIWSINTEQEYHEEKQADNKNTTEPSLPASKQPGKLGLAGYILKDISNRWYRWVAVAGILLQFCLFKYFYPQAGFISGDSYVYLQTAYYNFKVNTYPVGYSKFLRIFSAFTTSDTALIAFQYLFLVVAALCLLFSFFYFYRPGSWVKRILFIFVLFNPVFLFISNYVSSDALFIALSITWFTQLIWLIERPSRRLIIWHALILFLAFTVRYNALYYPLISAVAFALSRQKLSIKLAGIGSTGILIALFILYTSSAFKDLAGIREFSPFTGWQMANNAMYAYRYVDHKDTTATPIRLRSLDRTVRTYFDTTGDVRKHPDELLEASTVYMWAPNSPLHHYMQAQFGKDSTAGPVKRWALLGPLYAEYGSWLIKRYPMAFLKHYIWPNTIKYYAPPIEFLETYNMGRDSVAEIARIWFGYKSKKVSSYFQDFKVKILDFYPILAGIVNVLFLGSLIGFLILGGARRRNPLGSLLFLTGSLWLVNFVFSVFASPIALRFQIFPVLVYVGVSGILMEKISSIAFGGPKSQQSPQAAA